MNALSWLNELMTWLGRWVPRLILVKAGEAALRRGRNGSAMELPPGLYAFWPITTDITVMSTRLRTLEMSGQVHGREVIALVATWKIVRPSAAAYWHNIPANIDDRAACALGIRYAPDRSSGSISVAVLADLQQEFEESGVHIINVSVVQRGPIRTLRLMSDWGTHEEAGL